jgi:hypothetical protein
VIVTRPLAEFVAPARDGKLCFFPDHPLARERWFPEWESVLQLRAPLRRRPYLGGGLVALSVEARPDFLERWWEACELVPSGDVLVDSRKPFDAADQDALNALLMSEIEDEAIPVLPEADVALWDVLGEVEVVDPATLAVRHGGAAPAILHYSFSPKPWERSSWLRVRRDAFLRLLPRVLFGEDVRLRLDPRTVPVWIRPGPVSRIALGGLDVTHGTARAVAFAMPDPIRRLLDAARAAIFRRLRRGADERTRILPP